MLLSKLRLPKSARLIGQPARKKWEATNFLLAQFWLILPVTLTVQLLARWQDLSGKDLGPAMIRRGNFFFISWSQAMQGTISTNANLLAAALENLTPGVSQQAAVQISFAEYEGIRQELEYLLKRTDEV